MLRGYSEKKAQEEAEELPMVETEALRGAAQHSRQKRQRKYSFLPCHLVMA
jgi:hypothetical protein